MATGVMVTPSRLARSASVRSPASVRTAKGNRAAAADRPIGGGNRTGDHHRGATIRIGVGKAQSLVAGVKGADAAG